jgi:hypothetical protein
MQTHLIVSTLIIFSTAALHAQASQQRHADEVQKYLESARRGEAGVNPKDQAAARSGDQYAAARMRHQIAGNQITRRVNEGLITQEQASIERAAAATAYQREIAAIEQQKLLEEMRRQNAELNQLNRELERRRYQRR